MYHLIDQGCQVQNPMRSIFFYSHVYVYKEKQTKKILTPSPPFRRNETETQYQ